MKNISCLDCGPAPTSHRLAYMGVAVALLSAPFEKSLDFIREHIFAPAVLRMRPDRFGARLLVFFARIGLGKIRTSPDEKNSLRAHAVWNAADKLGIRMREFRPFGRAVDTYIAEYRGAVKCFGELPRPSRPLSQGYYWMDNKPAMRKHFKRAGIPVALGGACFTQAQALRMFRKIGGSADHPVIIKPSQGSRSRHTTIDIRTEPELIKAFKKAKQLSPFALVEQELSGFVYRASVIGGKVAGVISREQPTVVGDGVLSVRTLVEIENADPRRHGNTLFHEIPLDREAEDELARQSLNWESIPAVGRVVRLSQKVSRGVGAVTVDYTDRTHPDNIALFEKVGQVLDDAVVGIDFMIADISKSWKEQQRCGVIECNSAPFLDLHHSPYSGIPRDACGQLWKIVFADQFAA